MDTEAAEWNARWAREIISRQEFSNTRNIRFDQNSCFTTSETINHELRVVPHHMNRVVFQFEYRGGDTTIQELVDEFNSRWDNAVVRHARTKPATASSPSRFWPLFRKKGGV